PAHAEHQTPREGDRLRLLAPHVHEVTGDCAVAASPDQPEADARGRDSRTDHAEEMEVRQAKHPRDRVIVADPAAREHEAEERAEDGEEPEAHGQPPSTRYRALKTAKPAIMNPSVATMLERAPWARPTIV